MKIHNFLLFFILSVPVLAQQQFHIDTPFLQDYSIKYYFPENENPISVNADRNGNINVLTQSGLKIPSDGQFLYPGTFTQNNRYRTSVNKEISGMTELNGQFIFSDKTHIFSHAWAGKLFIKIPFPEAKIIAGDPQFNFMIADGKQLCLLNKDRILYQENGETLAIRYHKTSQAFWVLKRDGLFKLPSKTSKPTPVLKGNYSSFDLSVDGTTIFLGTNKGYVVYNPINKSSEYFEKVPVQEITAVKTIGEKIWFGTENGAFVLNENQKIDYYQGERWLPSNTVIRIESGPDNSVLVLTDKGLARICFKEITLTQKAEYFEKQVRSRHIRNGFNAHLAGMEKGNVDTGYMPDSDNDGLWTSMYLGAEAFRYAVTKSEEALENCKESLDAMERLYTINPVPGFPSRSFERSGFKDQLSNPERWQHSADKEWNWKATTSSDEAIGHMFVFGVIAELVDVPEVRNKAIMLMDTLMGHILKNDMYLVDYDGKPTLWGKWNPDYVNGFPTNVGDRKLNSGNITSMLQTAYRFTKKEKYKVKAFELLNQDGYLQNLMRPMKEIGPTADEGGDYAKMLSHKWNHSDDEMYFLGYWGLYRYAFNDTLKQAFKKSIIDHWETERPEKEGLWNIITAITGIPDFDLPEAIWYLQEHPVDLIQWDISNSHRKDIELLPDNFRKQTLKTVLPPDERPIQRHNANMFNLDTKRRDGKMEYSAGDIWLLPYWLGRYLEVIK